MRNFLLLAFFTPVVACVSSPLPGGGSDGSASVDFGPAMHDLRGATCADVNSAVSSWIGGNLACQIDTDCQTVFTTCGLEGQCGIIANRGAPGSYLTSLVDAWNKMGCATPCACPLSDPAPGCNGGVCGVKMTTSPIIGSPCKTPMDCSGLDCATDVEDFPGGYCTVRDCDKVDTPCPVGSGCMSGPNGRFYCLARCQQPAPCRSPDYRCCSGPGPTTGAGWCAPTMSFLCTAR